MYNVCTHLQAAIMAFEQPESSNNYRPRSSTTTSPSNNHVFLSFHAEKTGNTFADHIFAALVTAGVRTLRSDNYDEDDASAIAEAVQDSRMSVVVLSGEYVCSGSCLQQLEIILDWHTRIQVSGFKRSVFPVFYKVDPSELRKPHQGRIGEALAKLRQNNVDINLNVDGGSQMEKTQQRWREALREVANLAGITDQIKGDEEGFVKKIVDEVTKKLDRRMLHTIPHLVGMDSRAGDINLWLQDGSTDAGFLVISGMGGIGKTTLAKFVYNKNFSRFESSSFIENVRESHQEIERLQKKLLFDITRRRDKTVCSKYERINKIMDVIVAKRILLVLDGVDERADLDDLLRMEDKFYPGSKIILTTRLQNLLKRHEHHQIYEMNPLSKNESLEVLCWHAFGQDHPKEGYQELSRKVVDYCSGHPLALKVLGSSLSRKPENVWESAIDKLKDIPNNKIVEKLKISFDSLEDDHDRNLFLELVCYFLGKEKDYAITILEANGFFAKVGISDLEIKNLLMIDPVSERLSMHQLVREMGRDIIRQEATLQPGNRSRLWSSEDSIRVLRERTGKDIRGMVLDADMLEKEEPFFASQMDQMITCMPASCLLWQSEDSTTSDELVFHTEAFENMQKLTTLVLNRVSLTGSYKKFPRNLKWIQWRNTRFSIMPNDLSLRNLIVLELPHSSLKLIWMEKKFLGKLKILDLSYSSELISTPDFSGLPKLERLILKECIKLMNVSATIGELKHLVVLNLENCLNLRRLPQGICLLQSLREFSIVGCSPDLQYVHGLEKMVSLKIFRADWRIKRESSSSAGSNQIITPWRALAPLQSLWLRLGLTGPNTTRISNISLPISLVALRLRDCNLSEDSFPTELGMLSSLEKLDLGSNPLCSLPECVSGLSSLRHLYLNHCPKLKSLDSLPPDLDLLNISSRSSLEMMLYLSATSYMRRYSIWRNYYCADTFTQGALRKMGLIDIKLLGKDTMVQLRKLHALIMQNIIPVVVYDDPSIFSFCLPGEELPTWFTFKTEWDYWIRSVCFILPSLENKKFRGIYVCVLLSGNLNSYVEGKDFQLIISNHPSTSFWCLFLNKRHHVFQENNSTTVWISCWEFESSLSEYENVSVTLLSYPPTLQVKEVGVHPVYQDLTENKQEDVTSWTIVSNPSSSSSSISTKHFHVEPRILVKEQSSSSSSTSSIDPNSEPSKEEFVFSVDHRPTVGHMPAVHHVSSKSKRMIFAGLKGMIGRQELKVRWEKPLPGWQKLNTSGYVFYTGADEEQMRGGAGGLVRDENGKWIRGFAGNMGSCPFHLPQLVALMQGLQMASERRIEKLEVEVDSSLVLHWIYNADIQKHPFGNCIHRCRALISSIPWQIKLRHVKRHRNWCAHLLAEFGSSSLDGLSIFDEPPQIQKLVDLLHLESMYDVTNL